MDEQKTRGQIDWQEKVEKYPSMKKFMELGDDYVEWHDGREQALLDFIKTHPNVNDMQGNPTRILEAMDDFAAQQDFLINIGSDKGRIVNEIIAKQKPGILVELGGYLGYSAILFANEMRRQRPGDDDVHLWSLEFDETFAGIASELIQLAGLQDLVTVVTGSADDSLRRLKGEGKIEHIDFLFLDHVENLYEQDLKVAMDELELLPSGSVVVADNVVIPGAPEYRKYVRSHKALRSDGIKGLIIPGDMEDELEVSYVL